MTYDEAIEILAEHIKHLQALKFVCEKAKTATKEVKHSLKLCPVCGGDVSIERAGGVVGNSTIELQYIRCRRCCLTTKNFENLSLLIEYWNARIGDINERSSIT